MLCFLLCGICSGGSVAVTQGRAGQGAFPTIQTETIGGKATHHLVQHEVRASAEATGTYKAAAMKRQGRRVTCPDLWRAEPHRIKYPIQPVYGVFPTPSNIHSWGIAESSAEPFVFQVRNPGACPTLSPKGTQWGALALDAPSGPERHWGGHQYRSQVDE